MEGKAVVYFTKKSLASGNSRLPATKADLRLLFNKVVLREVVTDDLRVEVIVVRDRGLDELFPDTKRLYHAVEVIQGNKAASGSHLVQELAVGDDLLAFAIGVEHHDCDASFLMERDLDVGPLVQGEEDRGGRLLEIVLIRIDVDPE